jgi:hypothetical protein
LIGDCMIIFWNKKSGERTWSEIIDFSSLWKQYRMKVP